MTKSADLRQGQPNSGRVSQRAAKISYSQTWSSEVIDIRRVQDLGVVVNYINN